MVGPVLQSHSSQSCPPVWLCREGGVGVWGERRGRRARQLPPMLSVSTGGMAVEGYFLLLRSAAFLVTPIPPSQSVNLARLLKHKTDSSGLLPPPPPSLFKRTHTVLRVTTAHPRLPLSIKKNKKNTHNKNKIKLVGVTSMQPGTEQELELRSFFYKKKKKMQQIGLYHPRFQMIWWTCRQLTVRLESN